MDYGEYEKQLKKIGKKGKHKIGALNNRPKLHPISGQVWRLFNSLHRSRSSGMVSNPICFTDIKAILDLVGINHQETRTDYVYLITELDKVFMSRVDREIENANSKTGN